MRTCITLHENMCYTSWEPVLPFMITCVTLHENLCYPSWEPVLPFVRTCVHPLFLLMSALLIFLVFCVIFYCLFVFVLCHAPDVACVSGLPILVYPLSFPQLLLLWRYQFVIINNFCKIAGDIFCGCLQSFDGTFQNWTWQ